MDKQNRQSLHKKSASFSMSPSLRRYLTELASLREGEIEKTTQQFKTHVGDYRLVKSLGQGSGGEVFLAKHVETGEKVAIKIVKKSAKHQQWERMARQENATLRFFKRFPKGSQHIIKHITAFENEKEIGIVMEYAQGGDLFDLVKRRGKLPEPEAWRIFKQMIKAVRFIHGKRICHRDIQPSNVLLDKKRNVLIGDWGQSKTWSPFETTQENCGSLCYAAPEVFLADKHYVGPEIDLWSCGTVLYVMLSGQRPFWSSKTSDIYQNIQAGRYKSLPDYLSPEVSHLLSILLSTDPLKRATIVDVLNHPWMKVFPNRPKRADSSPFLLSPRVPHTSPVPVKRAPHPLLLARMSKGFSYEQLSIPLLNGFNERSACKRLSSSGPGSARLPGEREEQLSQGEGDSGDDYWPNLISPPSMPACKGAFNVGTLLQHASSSPICSGDVPKHQHHQQPNTDISLISGN